MTTQDLIEQFFPSLPLSAASQWASNATPMKVDVAEDDKEYVITADVPGIAKENLSVEFHENVLTISAEVSHSREETSGDKDAGKPRVVLRERSTGKYERSFRFGKEIDKDSISAKREDGVLTVKVAKRDPDIARQERRIEVR